MDLKLFKLHEAYNKHAIDTPASPEYKHLGRCSCGLYLYQDDSSGRLELLTGGTGTLLAHHTAPDIPDLIQYAEFLRGYGRLITVGKHQRVRGKAPYLWAYEAILTDIRAWREGRIWSGPAI